MKQPPKTIIPTALRVILFTALISGIWGCGKTVVRTGEVQTPSSDHDDAVADVRQEEQEMYSATVKRFRQWLENYLLPDMTAEKLIAASHDTIIWQLGGETYVTGKSEPEDFIPDYLEFMKRDWTDVLKPDCEFCNIYEDRHGAGRKVATKSSKYFDNDNEFRFEEYPVITLSLIIKGGEQARYSFMCTEDGFKLVSAIIRDHEAVLIYGKKSVAESPSDSDEPRVKRVYFSYGRDHKEVSANLRHCADMRDLNVHVETENYRDGDVVEIKIKIPNICGVSDDLPIELKLEGIVSDNKALIEDIVKPYIRR